MQPLKALIDSEDSVLVVIDVQERFLAKLATDGARLLVNRIGWLIEVSARLAIPIVVTAEDVGSLGGPVPAVSERLPPATPVYDKMSFGLAGQPDILEAVKGSSRGTAVLVGLETDVCVAQSALGLLDHGFQVVVVADATASPGNGHALGLERARRAGAVIMSVKSLYYEWMRTVKRDDRFRQQLEEIGTPEGIEL